MGFNRLEKRQKTLVLLLILAILFSVYYNVVFKAQSDNLQKATIELKNVNNQLTMLKSQMPDLEKEKAALYAADDKLSSLNARLAALEDKLPTIGTIPQLLGELVGQSSGHYIDFISIKPKTTKEEKEYAELVIEVVFNSTYTNFTNYLNRLEKFYEFLEATGIVVEEIKKGFNGRSRVTLALTTSLSETAVAKKDIKKVRTVLPVKVKRNPFTSVFKPVEKGKEKVYNLTGIIATGRQPTAIINDEVYKIGDKVYNKLVKQISNNMVVLSDGTESIVLTLQDDKNSRR